MTDHNTALQLVLAEYVSLKEEQSSRIIMRETALYINIGIFVSFLAFVFDKSDQIGLIPYLGLTYISLITFWIYYNNDLYINKIGDHIVTTLRQSADALLRPNPASGLQTPIGIEECLFPWETKHKSTSNAFFNRFMKAMSLTLSFLGPSILGLTSSFGMLRGKWPEVGSWCLAPVFVLIIFLGLIELTFPRRPSVFVPKRNGS